MHFSIKALSSLLLVTSALAQLYLQEDLSFGHTGKISPSSDNIVPNFHISGDPNEPQILSNKIILTPPAPGNVRGAAWAEKALEHPQWTADLDFRVTGPERGGGNLQIWLAKNGEQEVGISSIYTVGRFDGLALVVDQYGGAGGAIRGFLNDGSIEYKSHHNVNSLAFGHCTYSYRNLGRPSQIKLHQSVSSFKVTVDGILCFESPEIRIPTGYQMGVTAASAENPDSFEVFKLVVTRDAESGGSGYQMNTPTQQQQQQQQQQQNQQQTPPNFQTNAQGEIPDQPAETIEQGRQFADLHYRLQSISHQIAALQRDLASHSQSSAAQLEDLKSFAGGRPFPFDQLNAMDRRIEVMERAISQMTRDLPGLSSKQDYAQTLEELKRAVAEGHNSVLEGLGTVGQVMTASAPRLGFFIFVILGSQGLLALAYVIYKRRRAMMPKKYL